MSATILAAPLPKAQPASDFADWLSPILVKELRQGLKSRAFVSSFIVVQIVMIVLVGLQLLAREDNRGGYPRFDGFSTFFWAVIWVPLLVLMPARGLGAVSEEARGNTFDLVQLTRLTAFRIVAGKWVALVAQTLLLVTSVLPYAVLRYYFGGVDILTDLTVIAFMLTGSVVLTAGAIALSTAHLAVRIIVLVAALPLLSAGVSVYSLMRAFGGSRGGLGISIGPDVPWWFISIAAGAYVFMFIEFAAAKIAPVSENHSARKRFASLLIACVCVAVAWLGSESVLEGAVVFSVPLLAWVVVESLTEAGSALPATYAPFAKRGLPGRIAGRVLYPGWGTAVIFTAMVIALMFSAMEIMRHHRPLMGDTLRYFAFWPLLFFALISPLPVMFLFPRVKQRFWLYVLIQLVFVLLFAAAGIARDGRGVLAYCWIAFSPTSALVALMSSPEYDILSEFYLHWTTIAGLVILGILLVQMFRDFRFMSHLERLALKQQTPES